MDAINVVDYMITLDVLFDLLTPLKIRTKMLGGKTKHSTTNASRNASRSSITAAVDCRIMLNVFFVGAASVTLALGEPGPLFLMAATAGQEVRFKFTL